MRREFAEYFVRFTVRLLSLLHKMHLPLRCHPISAEEGCLEPLEAICGGLLVHHQGNLSIC